jgi:tRNA(Ile)-lysidine synthase
MRAPAREPGGNVQDWARQARYRCLAEAARDAGFDTIVTGHHREDQAETFLLRLARGSGVYGLSGMAEDAALGGLRLARPLLRLPSATLAGLAAASGLATAEDPSNRDERYDRVRVRRLMPTLAEHGLGAARLAETAGRLRRAAAALDHYAGALLLDHFPVDAFGVLDGPVAALRSVPEEVSLRALALMLQGIGGAGYTPRFDRVEALRKTVLGAEEADRLKRTLHGAVVCVEQGRLSLRREWGRDGIASIPASAGADVLWDRRFRVSVPGMAGDLTVGPLRRAGRRLLSNAAGPDAIAVLPGLFAEGSLVAVPDGIRAPDGEAVDVLKAECLVGSRFAGLVGSSAESGRLPCS